VKLINATFEFERATKNTLRFQEDSDVPVMGTIYIQKHALKANGGLEAKKIKVTIEEV